MRRRGTRKQRAQPRAPNGRGGAAVIDNEESRGAHRESVESSVWQERTQEDKSKTTRSPHQPSSPSGEESLANGTEDNSRGQKVQHAGGRLTGIMRISWGSNRDPPKQCGITEGLERPGILKVHSMPQLPIPVPRARELTDKVPCEKARPQRGGCTPVKIGNLGLVNQGEPSPWPRRGTRPRTRHNLSGQGLGAEHWRASNSTRSRRRAVRPQINIGAARGEKELALQLFLCALPSLCSSNPLGRRGIQGTGEP